MTSRSDAAFAMSLATMTRATLRVQLGDTVDWQGQRSQVHGVMHEGPELFVLLELAAGRAWVPSIGCDVLASPAPAFRPTRHRPKGT